MPPAGRRWFVFNAVGVLGFGVQIGVLAILVRLTGAHYLVATAIAVEAAVIHNFIWHQHWTWRDRRGLLPKTRLLRLARFHLSNGVISLGGNLAIVRVLTGGTGLDPVLANIVAIVACSLANFMASDLLVFRTAGLACVLLLLPQARPTAAPPAGELDSADLRAATLVAWTTYEQRVDERFRRLSSSTPEFFVHDEFRAPAWRAPALAGRIPMLRIDSPSPGAPSSDVPDGRIHHWAGAVFIPGATLAGVLRDLLAHAGHEAGAYEDVLASRLVDRNGDRLKVYMKLRRESIITVTYNTDHVVEYYRLGQARASARSIATRIAELADAGTPREREKPVGSDRGFLWRLNAYWRYEETNGGVLIECESVSLSRSVPFLVRPFVNGTVERIARESLERTLVNLRRVLASSR
jgi:putative flippase GtrA